MLWKLKDDELLTYVLALKTFSNNYRQRWFPAFRRYKKYYERKLTAELDKKPNDTSKLMPSEGGKVIDYLLTRIWRLVFQTKDYYKFEPDDADTSYAVAELNKKLVDFSNHLDRFEDNADISIQDLLIYGLAISLQEMYSTKKEVPVLTSPVDELGEPISEIKTLDFQSQTIIYPRAFSLDIFRFFPDPRISNINEFQNQSQFAGYESLSSLGELKNAQEEYINLEDIEPNDFPKDAYYQEYSSRGKEKAYFQDQKVDKETAPIALFTLWTKTDKIVIANEKIIIQKVSNGLRPKRVPFEVIPYIPRKGEFYPIGVMEQIEDDLIEQFHKRNQRIDEVNRNVNRPYFAPKDPNLPDSLTLEATRIYQVNLTTAQNIQQFPISQSTDQALQEEAISKSEVEARVPMNEISQGITPTRRETATVGMMLNENANNLIAYIVKKVGNGIARIMEQKRWLYLQFMPPDYPARIAGDLGYIWQSLNKEDIIGNLKVVCLVGSDVVPQSIKQQWDLQLTQQMMATPIGQICDWQYWGSKLFEAFGHKDTKRILPAPEKEEIMVQRENIALASGVPLPVAETDFHEVHLAGHMKAVEQIITPQPEMMALPEIDLSAFEQHITEHQNMVEQKVQPNQMPTLPAITDTRKASKYISNKAVGGLT